MTREEFTEKWGASMGHGFTDEELSADLDSLFTPAEGAEDILKNRFGDQYSILTPLGIKTIIVAMQDYATLHAQRLAEKMVEDMRQKLFSMRSSKETMDKLDADDKLMQYGYHNCINEMLMWTKSLSHD